MSLRKRIKKTALKKVNRIKAESLSKGKGMGKGKSKGSNREPSVVRDLINERAVESLFVKQAKQVLLSKPPLRASNASRLALAPTARNSGAAGKLQPGLSVTLIGLRAYPELNGQSATCLSWNVAKKRWRVRIQGGLERLVQVKNLQSQVRSSGEVLSLSPGIDQKVIAVPTDEKPARLTQFIKGVRELEASGVRPPSLTIVFCSTIETLQIVVSLLNQSKLQCSPLHAGTKQSKREKALGDFRLEQKRILVVVGDAASEFRSDNLRCLVNYDFPESLNEYCKRAGQLAHSGQDGIYCTLFDPTAAAFAEGLVDLLGRTKAQVDPMLRKLICKKG